jgi:HD-GYP domain-containing protein (c-di-GMP phosphodiesterase class II)
VPHRLSRPAAAIVLTHQERYDGTGYPQGLMGEEIPIDARIFAVADTLDAMTSDRPYRPALTFSTARAEVLRESGKQFDPEVVEAFARISEHVWRNIRQETANRGFHVLDPKLAGRVPSSRIGTPAEELPAQKEAQV